METCNQKKEGKDVNKKMIDFHTHILPNVDDGSRSIDETINLIYEAKNAGFQGIVFSSHYKNNQFETNVPERELLIKIIRDKIESKSIYMDLYIASEIFITDNIMEILEQGKASTLNNSSYVLFEMPLDIEPDNLYNVIHTLEVNKLIPVLAHPERYKYIYKEPELMNDLIEKGVLMQADYGSVLGQYGKKVQFTVKKFLEYNMIHFLGTNAHREKTIYQLIPEAREKIEKIIGKEKMEMLTTKNPQLVLNNKRIDIINPEQIKFSIKDKVTYYFQNYKSI